MCRSPNYEPHSHGHEDADPFTITAFYVRLRASRSESNDNNESSSKPRSTIPDSLTLLLYPPLSTCNQNNNNNNIPPFSPATLSLRRMRLPNDAITDGDVTVFGCKQKVRAAAQMLRFQLYDGETKLLKGAIRKLEDNHHSNLKLECCKCALMPAAFSISEADLLVAFDGHLAASGKVTVKERKMRNNKHRTNKSKLEDIPEETELHVDADVGVDDDVGADANPEIEEAAIHLEMDLEVLRKAMDMGIWVLCLGLGFMVSKASITNFRPRPTFF